MTEGLKLASAGDDVRVWDIPHLSLVSSVNPHSQRVGCICWNHNNQLLASAAGGDKIVLTYTGNGIKSSRTPIELAVGEEQTCVAFSSNSRYLLTGGKSKTLNIWDIKTRTLKKTFKDHTDDVTCCTFSSHDSNVASSSASGDIIIHNLSTGQGSSPVLRTPKTMCIRGIQYSLFKKTLLASVSDDGCLNTWDTAARKLISSYPEHKAPATGLAFSTINEVLLASVGLDKKIIFYDVQSKKSVKQMATDAPLTAVDFFHDGCTLAVGTTRGKIHLYDLRSVSTPIQSIDAHKSSVQSLVFQKPPSSSESKGYNKVSSSTKPEHSKGIAPKPVKPNQEPAVSTSNQTPLRPAVQQNGLQENTNDVFSPIGGGEPVVKNNNNAEKPDLIRPNADGAAVKDTNLANDVTKGIRHHPVGSANSKPVQENKVNGMSAQRENLTSKPLTKLNTNANTPLNSISPLAGESPSAPRKYSGVPKSNIMDRPMADEVPTKESSSDSEWKSSRSSNGRPLSQDSKNLSSSSSSLDGITTPKKAPVDEVRPPIQGTTSRSGTSSSSSTPPEQHKPFRERNLVNKTPPRESPVPAQSSQGNSINIPAVGTPVINGHSSSAASTVKDTVVASNGTSNGASAGSHGLQPFQIQFIRSMINEELEELRSSTHRDIVNLQVEMLRQFQIQQNEMKKLFQAYSINEALVEEIQRLREENHRLSTKF